MQWDRLPLHRHFLVTDNTGLAGYVLQRWFKRHLGTRHQDDLESWAMEALCEAAAKYDPAYRKDGKPVKFSTFACAWLWGRVRSQLDRKIAGEFRLPTHTGYGDDEDYAIESVAAVADATAAVDAADEHRHRTRRVDDLLRRLHPREQLVLRALNGVGEPHGQKATLVEVGKRLGVTRERVRQIGSRARKKLLDRAGAAS